MSGMGGEIGKAVAGAGQVAAAFGAGGPLAAGFVAGMFAVDAFTRALQNMNAAQDAAIAKQFAATDGVYARVIRSRAESDRMRLAAMTEEQRLMLRQTELIKQKSEAEQAAARLGGSFYDDQRKAHENEAKALNEEIILIGQLVLKKKMDAEETKKLLASPKKVVAKQEAQDVIDVDEWLMLQRGQLMAEASENRARAAQEEIDQAASTSKALAMQAREAQEERYAIEFEGWQKRRDLEKQQQEMVAGITEQYAGRLAGIGQNLVADLVAQREHAFERAALTIAAEAGQVLIGEGVKLAGFAVTSALTGNLPVAAAQGAGSAGLIAAGVGLGGAAMGLGGLLAPPDVLPPEPPRQTGSGAGGGIGGGNITVVYGGASGPSADMGAQNTTIAQGLAADRFYDQVVRR